MATLESQLTIGNRLGSGHFGDVFVADDPVHGKVAVKVLTARPGESSSDWQTRKAGLLGEAQLLKKAAHKHVVEVFSLAADTAKDAVLLVMEFCEGGSLQDAFDAGPLSLSQIRDIATDVSHGLSALHARSMIHRDIKPANLLRDSSGKTKLADFGLVTDKLLLGYGSQAGYLDHIAFEVHNGTSGTSARSDIWALGMTLYRLMHGAEWYSKSPAPKYVIPNGNFAKSLIWLPHIPTDWRRFIRKAMHDDTQLRFQTVGQFQTALAKLSVEPKWRCSVTAKEIRWRRTKGNRRIKVVWTLDVPNNCEWKAWSEPSGSAGNKRSLGGSLQPGSYKLTIRELEQFFTQP